MISIKVCKLSEIGNKFVIMVISIACLISIYNFCLNIIDKFSVNFIKFSINNNLCTNSNKNFYKEMIFCNIPIENFEIRDDIENEFVFLDNKDGRTTYDEQEKEQINNTLDTSQIKFESSGLLTCEKISDTKYNVGTVTINDYTKKKLDFSELEKSLYTELNEKFKVLIYHTHTSESYTGVDKYTDVYRTEDNTANVVQVGKALKEELSQYGIEAKHNTNQHDYPSYNGAYKSSLKTVENILKTENYDIIIDVHRDALASNLQYRPTAEINGETVAKLMFVVGTDAAGLKHDDWMENLKFAIAVQHRANQVFPGLFRDIHLSTSRYNQHTSKKSLILEVGATGNTIEEACLAMKYFAILLNSMK